MPPRLAAHWLDASVRRSAGADGRGLLTLREQLGRTRHLKAFSWPVLYEADHWCSKGHILLCLEGELHVELQDGRTFTLTPGVSYQVADNAGAHRSTTALGAKLFIVD
jgi:hypothetical protein